MVPLCVRHHTNSGYVHIFSLPWVLVHTPCLCQVSIYAEQGTDNCCAHKYTHIHTTPFQYVTVMLLFQWEYPRIQETLWNQLAGTVCCLHAFDDGSSCLSVPSAKLQGRHGAGPGRRGSAPARWTDVHAVQYQIDYQSREI